MPDLHDPSRRFDLVLLGATGFTGALTADYLAEHAPDDLRWALAGRNRDKLTRVRDRLLERHPRWKDGDHDLQIVVADSSDRDSLDALARDTRLVITTVGPYLEHGEPLVGACADAGTDYVDLTGEPEFVDRMYLAHHATAVASGARLVHACGFDSVPHDLGVLYTVSRLPQDVPLTVRGIVRSNAQFSGGTFHSALNAASRMRQAREAYQQRRRREGRPDGRSSRASAGKPHRDAELGYWLLPLPTVDPAIVARSGAALERYGPDFRYSHYAGVKSLRYAAGGTLGLGAVALAAQVGPLRQQLKKRVQQGSGPSEERRARSWFTVDFVGEGGGERVHTRVSGGDPGYDETSKMLAETALCLLLDDNPPTSGQVTTAQATGLHLIDRLERAGLRFEVVED